MKPVALSLLLLLAGCTPPNTTDKWLSRDVCVRSHTALIPMMTPISCGQNCTSYITTLIPHEVCDQWKSETYLNPHYIERKVEQ